MLNGIDRFSICIGILKRRPLPDNLLFGHRVLAFRKPRKFRRSYQPRKAECFHKPALPVALNQSTLLVITLGGGREFKFVIALRLA